MGNWPSVDPCENKGEDGIKGGESDGSDGKK